MISHLATSALAFLVFTASAQTEQVALNLFDQTCENQGAGIFTNTLRTVVDTDTYVTMDAKYVSLSMDNLESYCTVFGTEIPTNPPVNANYDSKCYDVPFLGPPTPWSVYCHF